jgi:hypothetical protein
MNNLVKKAYDQVQLVELDQEMGDWYGAFENNSLHQDIDIHELFANDKEEGAVEVNCISSTSFMAIEALGGSVEIEEYFNKLAQLANLLKSGVGVYDDGGDGNSPVGVFMVDGKVYQQYDNTLDVFLSLHQFMSFTL